MTRTIGVTCALVAALSSASCGEFVRSSRSPSQLIIVGITTASGATATPTFSTNPSPHLSDVRANDGTIFNDFGQASFRVLLRDPGVPGIAAEPSEINAVTVSRYRVAYRRADGRNTPGVDVPHPFDGAITVTISPGADTSAIFELVRHVAKAEAPLAALANDQVVITTIAEVTFYGRDQAGNDVAATASVQVNFGNFQG